MRILNLLHPLDTILALYNCIKTHICCFLAHTLVFFIPGPRVYLLLYFLLEQAVFPKIHIFPFVSTSFVF